MWLDWLDMWYACTGYKFVYGIVGFAFLVLIYLIGYYNGKRSLEKEMAHLINLVSSNIHKDHIMQYVENVGYFKFNKED